MRTKTTGSSATLFIAVVSFIAGMLAAHVLNNGATISSLSSIATDPKNSEAAAAIDAQDDRVNDYHDLMSSIATISAQIVAAAEKAEKAAEKATDAAEKATVASEKAEKAAVDAASSVVEATAAISISSTSESIGESESSTTMSSDSDSDSLSPYDSNVAHQLFLDTAKSVEPISDKITIHRYERMYGQFLLPFYRKKPNMKFFEIGLGCDSHYGVGASAQIWKILFPEAELWEGEWNADCVEKVKEEGSILDGINVLTGDQGNVTVLDRWIEESGGGDFDVIIDDGGHQNCEVLTTFEKFWPLLRPGGLYFIEGVLRVTY